MRIEVPKELNAMNIASHFERENILRQMAYHAKDRQLEKEQFEDDRLKYGVDLDIKEKRLTVNRAREIAEDTIQVASIISQASWYNPSTYASTAIGLAGAATKIAAGAMLHNLNVQEHQELARHGKASMERKGQMLNNKHAEAMDMDKAALYNMQCNVS